MPIKPPSQDDLQTALLAFSEVYALRHLDLCGRRQRDLISAEEFSTASRRLTAIHARIVAHWRDIPFSLPPEYSFGLDELADLIQSEIAGRQLIADEGFKTEPGQESLVASLDVIEALLSLWSFDEDEPCAGFGTG